MRMFKWWLGAELYICAALASAAGRSGIAILLSLAATVALLVALELAAPAVDDERQQLAVDRLALVLLYTLQRRNGTGSPTSPDFVNYCRRIAIGAERP